MAGSRKNRDPEIPSVSPAQGLALFLPETVQLFSVINQLSDVMG